MTAKQPLSNFSALSVSPSDNEGGLELGRLVTVLRRKIFVIAGVATVVASLAQLKAMTETPVYSSGFEILTKAVTVEAEVLSSLPETLTSRQQETAIASEVIDETKIRVLRSPRLLTPIIDELDSKYPNLTYTQLAKNLKIQASGPNILAVAYTNENPNLVRDVVSTVSEAYLNYSLEERQRDIRKGVEFVEEQLPLLEERVSDRQEQLQQLRQRYNLIDPELQATQLTGQVGELSQEQILAKTQLDETRLLYTALQNELTSLGVEGAATSVLLQDPRFQSLLDQLIQLDTKLAQDSVLYQSQSPEMQLLQAQRQSLLPLLQQEGQRVERQVLSQIRGLENRNQALSQSIAALNQQIKELSVITREYTDIQRELQIATDNLNQFLAQREALRIDASQRQVPWQLLTPPGEPQPSTANVTQSLILGTILGLLLGIGVALALDKFSNLIHSEKEIKNILKLPILGLIPWEDELGIVSLEEQSTVWDQPAPFSAEFPENGHHSPVYEEEFALNGHASNYGNLPPSFVEAFRSLYASIRLLRLDNPIRSLVVSSAVASSGKTTVSIYLAQAAAAVGHRVLLVDADLRRPRIKTALNLPEKGGLTDAILMEKNFEEFIQRIPAHPNLSVLTAGTLPPDPVQIISSQAMQTFMQTKHDQFDLVIYDAPPLLGLADASLLTSHTDGMLFVVRLHQTKRTHLEEALEDLQLSAIPMIGAVANASENRPASYNYYYQDDSSSYTPSRSPRKSNNGGFSKVLKPVFKILQK